MVPCALLGVRRVVFASANPLVSVTGNPSPAASFLWLYLVLLYYQLDTTPSVAALSLGRIPGRLQCPREWPQVVSLRPVPRLAPTVRENRHRHIFPRSPGLNLNLFHLCAAAAFVLPQQHSSSACPAVPRPRHSTRPNSGNRGILTKENKPNLSRIFSSLRRLNPLQLSTSFWRLQLQRMASSTPRPTTTSGFNEPLPSAPSTPEPGTPPSTPEPGTPPSSELDTPLSSEPGTPPSPPSEPSEPGTPPLHRQRAQELWERNNADPDRALLPFEGLWQRINSTLLSLEQLPFCTCIPRWHPSHVHTTLLAPVTDPKLQLCLSCLGYRFVSAGSAVNPLLLP